MIMQRHHRRRHPIVPVEYGEEKATNEVCSPVLTSLHNLLPPPSEIARDESPGWSYSKPYLDLLTIAQHY